LDPEAGLDWNGDLDDPNDSEDDRAAADECNREQENSIEGQECPEQQDVSTAKNHPELFWLTLNSYRPSENS